MSDLPLSTGAAVAPANALQWLNANAANAAGEAEGDNWLALDLAESQPGDLDLAVAIRRAAGNAPLVLIDPGVDLCAAQPAFEAAAADLATWAELLAPAFTVVPLQISDDTADAALKLAARRIGEIRARAPTDVVIAPPLSDDAGQSMTQAFVHALADMTASKIQLDLSALFARHQGDCVAACADLDRLPADLIGVLAISGHACLSDDHTCPDYQDLHDRRVVDRIWDLFAHAIARFGAFPTLVTWLPHRRPGPAVMQKELAKANALLRTSGRRARQFTLLRHTAPPRL